MQHQFVPEPNKRYEIVLKNWLDFAITFTKENNIYPEEEFCDFQAYECYYKHDTRFVCYVRVRDCDKDEKYVCLKTKDMNGDIEELEVIQIFLDGKLQYDVDAEDD